MQSKASDYRTLTACTDLTAYLARPGLAQVFRIEHTWIDHGQIGRTVRFVTTSLAPEIGTSERLLSSARVCGWGTGGDLMASSFSIRNHPDSVLRAAATNLFHLYGVHAHAPDLAIGMELAPITRAKAL